MAEIKKMYYTIGNEDAAIICGLKELTDMLEAEASDYNEDSNKQDNPQWFIELVFLTEDEYANLPEAY